MDPIAQKLQSARNWILFKALPSYFKDMAVAGDHRLGVAKIAQAVLIPWKTRFTEESEASSEAHFLSAIDQCTRTEPYRNALERCEKLQVEADNLRKLCWEDGVANEISTLRAELEAEKRKRKALTEALSEMGITIGEIQ